jgi:hypothetical protein
MQPVARVHVSVVQALLSSQTIDVPAQTPSEQMSPPEQALPSSQGAALLVLTQAPVAGSQVSSVQRLPSLQITGVNTQMPVAGSHASVVQALVSLHTMPAQGSLDTQVPVAGSQASPAMQVTGA